MAISLLILFSRTQSLTSSVANFKFENGRRYHSYREGSYHMPNDEQEQERLDMQHQIYRMALDDKLFLAPVANEKLLDVLDVGCGTGMWCIDVSDENPQAQVLGIDLRCVLNTFVLMINLTFDLQPDSARSVSLYDLIH